MGQAGRCLLLGVTGSVAAFRGVELASAMTQRGWRVLTTLTEAAKWFVQPLSFTSVTGEPVFTYSSPLPAGTSHVTVSQEADVMAVAPATAQTMAKLAGGFGDNFLSLSALAFKGPVLVAPAMNPRMYSNPAVRENVDKLSKRGYRLVGPVEGRVADGERGLGRMAPVEEIIRAIEEVAC